MASETPSRPFDDQKASRYIDKWVSTVDHPELVWAWDVARGIIDLYAAGECRREYWFDWFESWNGGDAHYGVHGAKEEVANAIPLEHWDSFCVTLDHARITGETGRMPTDDATKRRPTPTAATVVAVVPAKPAAVVLRLVVNNVAKVSTTPPRHG